MPFHHEHSPEEPGGDLCHCGQMICPDTLKAVAYNHAGGDLPSYWHLDGSACFMHQVVVPCDPELVKAWMEWVEFALEDDPDYEAETYPVWLQDQINNHEQIWREEPKERDLTEQYLQVLRNELEQLGGATA